MSVRAGFSGYRKRKPRHDGRVYRLMALATTVRVDGREYDAGTQFTVVELHADGSYTARFQFYTEAGARAWAREQNVELQEVPR